VNDSFQWWSLPLPSLTIPADVLPSAIGRSLEYDLDTLQALQDPPRPFVAVLGGDRSYRRLHGMRGLVLRADQVLVGGAMAVPFLQALGIQPALDTAPEFLAECREVYGLARRGLHQIELPTDLLWLHKGRHEIAPVGTVLDGEIVDIGPASRGTRRPSSAATPWPRPSTGPGSSTAASSSGRPTRPSSC
jgi:3-phosphoglycerate kinase